MRDDISDTPINRQGKPRVVWRGKTLVVVTEEDGALDQ